MLSQSRLTIALAVIFCWAGMALVTDAQDRGGFRGGEGGGFRGGEGGGFRGGSRGGDSGGFRSSRGGSPFGGGFSPADLLRRFDENGDGKLEPSESQGRAGFFLQRIASSVPGIDLSKPVKIDKLAAAMQKAREQGGSGGSPGSTSGRGNSTAATVEPLVPGFGLEEELPLPPGFGAEGELFTVKVVDDDKREADERFRRYDLNRDGVLDRQEISRGRWSDDPFSYDRNRDGKLTPSEMAVRYARRRVAQEEQSRKSSSSNRSDQNRESLSREEMFARMRSRFSGGGDRGSRGFGGSGFGGDTSGGGSRERGDKSNGKDGSDTKKDKPGGIKSYRVKTPTERLPKELLDRADWFARDDKNADGQVAMSEFATTWSAATLRDFARFDLNGDGFITAKECLKAVQAGAQRGSTGASSTSVAATSSPSTASPQATTAGGQSSAAPPADAGEIDPRYLKYAQGSIKKYDKNGDGVLVAEEWAAMSRDPSAADTNGDGKLTVTEYATSLVPKK